MRFLMKTFVVRPAPRLIHALRQTLSGCARALAAVFLSSTKPARAILGLLARHNYSSRSFGTSSILFSGKLLLGQHPKSLIALVCTPSRWVLSHTLSNVRGRLRPTVE